MIEATAGQIAVGEVLNVMVGCGLAGLMIVMFLGALVIVGDDMEGENFNWLDKLGLGLFKMVVGSLGFGALFVAFIIINGLLRL